jgi:hypothetical protein
MKRRYLVCYDYGMGGLWSYVLAESAEAISGPYPELTVFEDRPTWMSAEEEASWNLKVDDIDAPDPSGLLLHAVAERDHR